MISYDEAGVPTAELKSAWSDSYPLGQTSLPSVELKDVAEDEVLNIAYELSHELGKCKVKQDVVTPILESVVMDDLFYTQASIKASFGDRTPLGDLVSWLTACAARDGAGHKFPFDREQWREGGRLTCKLHLPPVSHTDADCW